jgi:hypothetical protein
MNGVRSGDRRAVAQRPHLWVTAAAHRRVDGNLGALIVYDRNCTRDRARNDAGNQHDRARIDRFVRKVHTSGLDGSNGCGNTHLATAAVEHAARHGCQSCVDLGQDLRVMKREGPHAIGCLQQPCGPRGV